MLPTTERQTIAIFPGVTVFEHVVILEIERHQRTQDTLVRRPLMSLCSTRYPQPRCSCFMYALAWCDDKEAPLA
jgi:hypothetical protein